jgi:hypothetical protein
VCLTELLKSGNESIGGLSVLLRLLFDRIEKAIQFRVDLKERIRFGNC